MLFGYCPHRLSVEGREELRVFPLNILFSKFRKEPDESITMGSAVYNPDISSLVQRKKEWSMTYRNQYGGNSYVVITIKIADFSYKGEKFVNGELVGSADGVVRKTDIIEEDEGWRLFFFHLTLIGLTEDEQCRFEYDLASKQPHPFVAFIRNENDFTYEAYLVNQTDISYTRVHSLTGSFCSVDEGLLETSKSVKEEGLLAPHSSLLLEKSDLGGLDFVIWYHLDLYAEGSDEPLRISFNLPKGGLGCDLSFLPIIEKEGARIELEIRSDGETIEEEVKHLKMDGGYSTIEALRALKKDQP